MAERLIRESDVIKLIDEWLDGVGVAYVAKGFSYYAELKGCIADAPTIEAYTGAEYMHLLKLAKKMHTWIFLHTLNEDETYKELGLTDEDNALLGSFGKFYYSCNPNTKPFPQAYENGDHIAEVGKKEGE